MDNNETQECFICKKSKKLDQYYINNKTNVIYKRCKECEAKRAKEYKQRTAYKPEEKRAKVKKDNNSGETKKCSTCKFEKSKDNFESRRNQCIDCRTEYLKNYHAQEEVKKRVNENFKKLKENNLQCLVKTRLRARLSQALTKAKNSIKCDSTMNLTGCTIEFLIKYIEDQFTEGMHWRHKDLSMDHKIPCDYFDLTDPKQQRRCFHYTNLQPMWLSDNIRKGNTLLPEYGDLLQQLNSMFI